MSEIYSFKRCIICGFNSIEQVSYFRFPRDKVNVAMWAKFCGIDVGSVKTSHRLCSKHFHPKYLRRSIEKNRYILLKHAIPCYLYPGTENKPTQNQDDKTYYASKHKKRCYLCGANRGEDLSYFSFPRDEETKRKWAKFCDMKVENILMSHRLCSAHFLSDDILEKKPFGGPKRLREKAVPACMPKKNILVENEVQNVQNNESSDNKIEKPWRQPRCSLCGHSAENFISFFSFPEEPELRSAWAAYCNLSESQLTSSHRLCHLHFTENEVLFDNRSNGGLLKLKPDAVPSVTYYHEDTDLHDDHSYYSLLNNSAHKGKPIPPDPNLSLKVKLSDSLVKRKKQTKRRFCCLCDAADEKAPFYSFPKDSTLRAKWAKFCGIPVDSIRTSDCLCQRHFKEKDLSGGSNKTGRLRLKPAALPVLFGSKCKSTSTSNRNQTEDLVWAEALPELKVVTGANDSVTSVSSSNNCEDRDNSSTSSVRRRGHFQKPRFFRDIKLSDLRSPYHIERCFNLANSTISQQKETLKVLRAQKRRMILKLGTLKNLVKNLHSEKHTDECAADSLLSFIDTIVTPKPSLPGD